MKTDIILRYLLSGVVLLQTLAFATRTEVAHQNWDGVGVYLTVDADKVRARIAEYLADNPGAPHLYIPSDPGFPFPGVGEGQHVSYFEFGYLELSDFDDSVAPRRAMSIFAIPFLSASEGGPGLILELDGVAEGSDVPDPSLLTPYREPDAISVTATGAQWQDGGERFAIEYNATCEDHGPISKRSEAVIAESLWLPYSTPDFAYCGRHPEIADSNPYCSSLERILPEVEDNLPNICVAYEPTSDGKGLDSCPVSLEITEMTPGVREMLLLGPDDPINIVKAERFFGDSSVVLKYPCV